MTRYRRVDGERITLSVEEEAALDAKEKSWADGAAARAMAKLREERNNKLHETDWWGASDRTMSVEQAQYRADLRNFPAVVDIAAWPDVTWPTVPES